MRKKRDFVPHIFAFAFFGRRKNSIACHLSSSGCRMQSMQLKMQDKTNSGREETELFRVNFSSFFFVLSFFLLSLRRWRTGTQTSKLHDPIYMKFTRKFILSSIHNQSDLCRFFTILLFRFVFHLCVFSRHAVSCSALNIVS